MKQYRITKYNPIFRENGIYIKDEWTDYSDIGCYFSGEVLTKEKYFAIEKAYLNVLNVIMKKTNLDCVFLDDLEVHEKNIKNVHFLIRIVHVNIFSRTLKINGRKSILNFCKLCLRNKVWGRLSNDSFFIHFGRDYYMYVGTDLPYEVVDSIASGYGLFAEQIEISPYLQ